ncbi:hypothetical protein ACFSO7_00890 [Bacillus sp. CGMCC 1.16607]|uniref:hypothetical protein n=1 Tax=Bacillus sp. CGMCC 1.16607 TaxID=3351842 RepID=UPI003628B0A8
MGKIILSAVLSFLFPGLGQLYHKQKVKGIILIVIGIILVYVNIFGWRLPLTVFRFIAAGEAIFSANKRFKSAGTEAFLSPKKALLEIGISVILIFMVTFVPYRMFIKPEANYFSQNTPEQGDKEMKQAEERMISYLEEKYQKEFTIKQTDYIREQSEYTFVISASDEDFLFTGSYFHHQDQFEDGYMNAKWGNEFDDKVEPAISTQFQNIWKYNRGVRVEENVLSRINPLEIPSYDQLRIQFPDDYEQKFQLAVFENEDEKKQQALIKVNHIVQAIKAQGIKNIQFHIYFYNEKLFKEKGKDIILGAEYNKYLLYDIGLIGEDLEKIVTPGDLEDYFIENKD